VLTLPETDSSLLIRTDYTQQATWQDLCRRIESTNDQGFRARVAYFEDPRLSGLGLAELSSLAGSGPFRTFFFVVDVETIEHPENPVLVVDLTEEPGRTFRVIPAEMWSVENNLSLSNMDFSEFADSAGADGIFRGFA
jgi:hypothetical protein